MEGKLQTSFIPKKPVVETKAHNGPTTNIFSMIAWFIFIVALASSVGVYFYQQYLNKSLEAKNVELTNIVNNFKINTSIDHFAQLDAQLKAVNGIINRHLAFTAVLDLISDATIRSIQFTDLRYAYDDGGDKTSLSLNGKGVDFASVALQSDRLSTLTHFRDQNFSGISLDKSGNVMFNFSASIDTNVLKYKDTLNASSTDSNEASI